MPRWDRRSWARCRGARSCKKQLNIITKPSTAQEDRKSTRLNSSHGYISYAVFCLKKKKLRQSHYPPLHSHFTSSIAHKLSPPIPPRLHPPAGPTTHSPDPPLATLTTALCTYHYTQ